MNQAELEQFFARMQDYRVETRFYENGESFEVEELYQAFKARMLREVARDLGYAILDEVE